MIEITRLIAEESKVLLVIMAVLTVHLLLPLIILGFLILQRLIHRLWETFFPSTEVPEKEKRLRLKFSLRYDTQTRRSGVHSNSSKESVNTSENKDPESDPQPIPAQQEDSRHTTRQAQSGNKAIATSGQITKNLRSRKSKAA